MKYAHEQRQHYGKDSMLTESKVTWNVESKRYARESRYNEAEKPGG